MDDVKLSKFDKAVSYAFKGFDLFTHPLRKYAEKKISNEIKNQSSRNLR